MKYLKILIETFLLIFVFLLPFQTKLILSPASNNFVEISFYLCHLPLLCALICFSTYWLLKPKKEKKVPLYSYFMVAFVFFYSLSLFFASNRLVSAYKVSLLILGVALFYMLRHVLREDDLLGSMISRLKIIHTFLITVFLHASLGIYQFLSQSTFASKYLGVATHNPELAGTSVIETMSGRWLRAYGGLDHPNILAGVLVIALLLCAYLLSKKKLINSRLQIYGVLSIFVAYFIYLTALFFTFSRSAWLAFFAGSLVLALAFIKKKDKWVTGRYLFLLFFSLILFSLLSFSFKDLLTTRIQANARLEQVSLIERSEELKVANSIIKKQAWFGLGAGNYTLAVPAEFPEREIEYPQPVHNSFILVLAESGVFALLSLLLFIFFFFKETGREELSLVLILSLFILMLFEHWFFSIPFGLLFLMFVLGLI